MIRRGAALAAILAVFVAILCTAAKCEPESNNDGSGSKNPGPGGQVRVALDSAASVKVYSSWGSKGPAGRAQTVKPGSSASWHDSDGLCSPPKLHTRVIITWALIGRKEWTLKPLECLKINNIETATVTVLNR